MAKVRMKDIAEKLGVSTVTVSKALSGQRGVDYLFRKGHRKIAFVGTVLSTGSITDRYLGYLNHGDGSLIDWNNQINQRTVPMIDRPPQFK